MKMNSFDGFVGTRPCHGGHQSLYRFDNGYGASVIKHDFSYGVELAVVKYDSLGQFSIVYDTPITDDVIGHMTEEQLVETLKEVKAL